MYIDIHMYIYIELYSLYIIKIYWNLIFILLNLYYIYYSSIRKNNTNKKEQEICIYKPI